MGMHYTAHLREVAVDSEVSRSIRRRTKIALNDIAIQIYNYHILSLHIVVAYAAWLNNNETTLAIESRNITPSEDYKVVLYEIEVSLQDLLLKFL
jgi:hypothetical protein